ncbi:MAG: TraR/DksA family transcriptional regulator [Planctomycetota bacterium]|nr:TraR/DksA family transcriptional regulator [Planctomycetaceae bacterium]MDQ3333105.1 TraR/DksA family transcriptional regulator [Planctomycetota bacterium]
MTRKERLERLRKLLIERRDGLRRKLDGDLGGAAGSSQGDEGDAATSHSADELDTRIAAHLSGELTQINLALQKFKEGRYGICEMTGVPIPIARLEALPYTLYSVEAQRLIEVEGYDPEEYRPDHGWARAVEHESRLAERNATLRELEEVED